MITKVCFEALPRSAFTTLQKRLFPIYFRMQFAAIALTAITYPPRSLLSLLRGRWDLVPLPLAAATSLLNLTIYEPRARAAMIKRIHQGKYAGPLLYMILAETTCVETIDGRKHDAATISLEMAVRKREFSRSHAMCIHINLMTICAMTWYGIRLAGRLSFD